MPRIALALFACAAVSHAAAASEFKSCFEIQATPARPVAQRKAAGAAASIDAARFRAALPSHGQQHADHIVAAAREFDIDPFAIAALIQNESDFGKALKNGTGDFGQFIKHRDAARTEAQGGYACGLMQLDFRIDPKILSGQVGPGGDWRNARDNIRMGTWKLAQDRDLYVSRAKVCNVTADGIVIPESRNKTRDGTVLLKWPVGEKLRDPRPLKGDLLTDAVLASRNGGTCGGLWGAAIGKPGHGTVKGEYVNRARKVMDRFRAKYLKSK